MEIPSNVLKQLDLEENIEATKKYNTDYSNSER